MFLKRIIGLQSRNDSKSFSDEDLISAYKRLKDTKFIGELFERYTHLVFGVCMKYLKNEEDSKDAVMQIFEGLFQKLSDHEVSNFKSWIYSVTKNHCLMMLRKEKSEARVKENIYAEMHNEIMESADFIHPYNNEGINDEIPKLQKGIEQLKTEQRTCIELLYLQDKSYQEVSDITGYSMKKVKSYIQNGKRNLKIFLEQK
ncbi:MAG: sigma-70 family RNA polymerase sigma factor [Bacteroidales bacterium]